MINNIVSTNVHTTDYTHVFYPRHLVTNNIAPDNAISYLVCMIFMFIKSNIAYFLALIYFIITYLLTSISSLSLAHNKFFYYLIFLFYQAKPVLAYNIGHKSVNELISVLV